jgi:hypothetical protein
MVDEIRLGIAAALRSGDEPAFDALAGELFDAHIRAIRDVASGAHAQRRFDAAVCGALRGMQAMQDHLMEGGAPEDFEPRAAP